MRSANVQERPFFAAPRGRSSADLTLAYDSIGDALVSWMEMDQRARLLVDDRVRVWWTSPAADALIGQTGALLIRSDHVRTSDTRFDRQLRELIASAKEDLSIQCIPDPRQGEHLVITAQRLRPPSHHLIGLTLQSVTEEFGFRLADLHHAFGFTPTEERVARHLLCGRTADETAQHLNVSLETVRTHIKRSYVKLGVSSREAFFHRLTPFIVPT